MVSGTPKVEQAAVWDRRRVLALAPDSAFRQAALLLPAQGWSELGRSGGRLWGRCRGSEARTYEVVAELDAAVWACSCPSRTRPCKHVVGLLLRWCDGLVPDGEVPDFVGRRLSAGAASQGAAAARPVGQLADPGAAAARAAARVARVDAGLDELAVWLGDQLRTGLAGLERDGHTAVEAVAARMVDAQAPGVAGLLRRIPGELALEGWPAQVLEQLAGVHLLIQAHRRLPTLPTDLAATVRSHVGYPVTRAEVLARPGVDDAWLAVGQVDTVESRLESRRVWLWGRQSCRWALWLTFVPTGGAPDATITLGERFCGRVHFYPGAGQLRAVLGETTTTTSTAVPAHELEPSVPTASTLTEAQHRFAALQAADPWATRLPAAVRVTPVPPVADERWRLRDRDGSAVDVLGTAAEPWPLVAHARGGLVPVVVEWSAAGVRPLAVLGGEASAADVLRVV